MNLVLYIKGTPKPQPRPRAVARGGFARVYNPKTADDWKAAIKKGFKGKSIKADALAITLHLKMPRPKIHFNSRGELKTNAPRLHTKKPDVDNLAKAVLDALVDVKAFSDDSIVTQLIVTKEYANQEAGCLIDIKTAYE